MTVKHKFNASVTKLQHEMWKNKVITFLNGGPAPTGVTHHECALGKWLYEEGGMETYGSIPEMKRLERFHAKFHDCVKGIIDKQNKGDANGAWSEYEQLKLMATQLPTVPTISSP
ncbi:hypothetical protein TI04_06305 [Achromatium sp. WMS2]|nr:hypothetical protein TI04_06305 [Achromatium sp. WMS2]